jgi:hypothetical protein
MANITGYMSSGPWGEPIPVEITGVAALVA